MTHIENMSLAEAIAYLLKHHSKQAVIKSTLLQRNPVPRAEDVPKYLHKDVGLEVQAFDPIKSPFPPFP